MLVCGAPPFVSKAYVIATLLRYDTARLRVGLTF